jgi:hypothetical protein
MIVTTGGRGCSVSSASTSSVSIARSTSESLTRVMLWPNSVDQQLGGVLVDRLVIVTGMPILNSALTRSAPFSAMRLASSWTVIASGTTTSRTAWPAPRRAAHAAMFLLAGTLERGELSGRGRRHHRRERAVDGELAGDGGDRRSRRGRGLDRARALGRGARGAGRKRRGAGRSPPRASAAPGSLGDFVKRGRGAGSASRGSSAAAFGSLDGTRGARASSSALAIFFGAALFVFARLDPRRGAPRGGALPRACSCALLRPRAAAWPAIPGGSAGCRSRGARRRGQRDARAPAGGRRRRRDGLGRGNGRASPGRRGCDGAS